VRRSARHRQSYCRNLEDRNLIREIIVHLWKSHVRYDERFKLSTWIYRVFLEFLNALQGFENEESNGDAKPEQCGGRICSADEKAVAAKSTIEKYIPRAVPADRSDHAALWAFHRFHFLAAATHLRLLGQNFFRAQFFRSHTTQYEIPLRPCTESASLS
jgi:hypothetical protein